MAMGGGGSRRRSREPSRYDLRELVGGATVWGHPLSRIFERQEKLFRYLDASKGRDLRGWSVESAEPLIKRLRRGETARLFDSAESAATRLVPRRWCTRRPHPSA